MPTSIVVVLAEGFEEIAECPIDDHCVTSTLCGTTIQCQPAEVNCLSYPACPDGFVETETCPADGTCTDATMCGVTIHCID